MKDSLPIVPFVAVAWFVWCGATRSQAVDLLVAVNAVFQVAAAIELAFAGARALERKADGPAKRFAPAFRALLVNSAPSAADR